MADDLKDRLADREIDRRSRTERELDALGEGRTRAPQRPPRREAPPPRQVEERRGVGRDLVDETTRVILAGIDRRIAALQESGANPSMLAELRNRRKLILEEAERARQ